MNYAQIRKYDVANGPGIRTSLFVSGCRNNCPGCFNKEAQKFSYGKPYGEDEKNLILQYLSDPKVSGLSILGGEPFEEENQPFVLDLVKTAKETVEKNIWIYSGYVLERDLVKNGKKNRADISEEILAHVDVLVDGPFVLDKKNLKLRFRGSENQRIIDIKHFLTFGDIREPFDF